MNLEFFCVMFYTNFNIMRKNIKYNKNISEKYKDIERMQIRTEKNQKEIKSHGSYEFPLNVSEESIKQYESGMFLWHWHPEIELTWIMSGQMEYRVNDKVYQMREGEGIFGNSNTLHSGFQKDGQDCHYLSITFHPRFIYGYESSGLQTKYVNFITENDSWSSLKLEQNVDWQREILGHMQEIYHLSKEKSEEYELQVHILLLQIWQKLYRYFAELPEGQVYPHKNMMRLRSIIAYIQDNYNRNISLDEIAGTVNICKSECCRFFKKYMNMTMIEYQMFLRIQNSLPLLRQGRSITEIAGIVGFNSSAYYGQIFKRYMKCTPKEYERRNRCDMGKRESPR